MASLIDLRRRIRSVKNTQQITKAMQMVAAAKLRRAQDRILAARPYAEQLRKITEHLAAQGAADGSHPLLATRPERKVLLAVVSGDKGLAGAFNAYVIRRAEQFIREHDGEVDLLLMGKRGAEHFKKKKTPIRASHRSLFANVRKADADEISADLTKAFIDEEYDAVYVIYNAFVTVIKQDLTVDKVLPISAEELEAAEDHDGPDYIYEPSAETILADLLPRYVALQIYRVLLESQAAEHAARMTAMDAATKNAKDLIEKLTLVYNQSRQAAITTELIEVVSGAAALEG